MEGKKHYAVIAGISAASASFFGKLPSFLDVTNFPEFSIPLADSLHIQIDHVVWAIRILSIIVMIVCNAMVWTFFVKALQDESGSLGATLISAATNYCFSAFLGCFLFGEETTFLWWIGTVIVLCGLLLVLFDNVVEDNKKTE